jgi:hypothetical protein
MTKENPIVKYGLFGLIAIIGVGVLAKLFGGKIPQQNPPTGYYGNEPPKGGCGCGMKK